MQVINNYNAHTDSKKRITLRKSKYDYYHVKEYDNGCLVLEPRELVKPKNISDKALKVMDESVANLKKGRMSAPVDLSDF
ncbi:hypothetical protein [Lactobacillus helsingborgensis]|uniref:hypothetical protein n=1 Tax=Lactobacillus helsingborgensis TaxID=1218494 RepID=UPI002265067C|nr:hypothetical protein [Lactobacillus helsingborgensis]UZX32456.1 hypothetical protein LDX52_09205 [Lactobacillus helsingborgensis]